MNRTFTDEDRLRLLQLTTRRAMAERWNRAAGREGGYSNADLGGEAEPANIDVTTRWRLIPEGISLYGWQQECLPLWLSHGRGTVKVATGGGKTLFAMAAAQHLQNEREPDLRLVVVVPTIPLLFQWYDEVRRGNLPDSAIGLMGGGQDLPLASDLRVLICVLNSARDRLPGFVSRARWSEQMLLIVDECHRANADQARRIFDAKPRYLLGLSATPEQDLEAQGLPTDEAYEKSVVGQALGPIIYDFTIKQSLAAGLLTPFEVWHIGLPLSPPEANEHARLSREITDLRKTLQIRHGRSRSKQGFLAWCQTQASRGGPVTHDAARFIGLANRRKRLLYRAGARMEVVLGILSESLADHDSRAIVFHESIEEIENLFLQALERGIPAVLEHSQLPDNLRAENIEAFREGVARVIISAKSLVEGFNVPSADLGIIAASSGSVRQRIQSLGRMLRRKPGDRAARVYVLYVRDTEDEAIYEKADWENVIGAERNRYFVWRIPENDRRWPEGLEETATSPRTYRSPSWEVDVTALSSGTPYPGQTQGREVRVDRDDNLRVEDGALVPVPPPLVEAILATSPHRRARITPAGHLIVRANSGGSDGADWRFLGTVIVETAPAIATAIRLRLRTASGRRVITREKERRTGVVPFALGPEASRTPEAGRARDQLLEWIRREESRLGRKIRDLYWDGSENYWLEVEGERIDHDVPLPPLEFSE